MLIILKLAIQFFVTKCAAARWAYSQTDRPLFISYRNNNLCMRRFLYVSFQIPRIETFLHAIFTENNLETPWAVIGWDFKIQRNKKGEGRKSTNFDREFLRNCFFGNSFLVNMRCPLFYSQ